MNSTPKVISSLSALDEMLSLADQSANDDELRKVFGKFRMEFPFDLPDDPASQEYYEVQFKFYEYLAGKPYKSENEESVFDVVAASKKPFPYFTESPTTVGNQLLAIGHIIKTMNLEANSSILEFGPGWGNTTINLARMGYKVTAIDIEPRFVELIQTRAKNKGIEIDVKKGDFNFVNETNQEWDAVLFFECFHHCADHIKLIKQLDNVVKKDGKIIFAAEPITDGLPMPWGFRLDGESLWAIRKHGWCELGFQETYFRDLLAANGWSLSKHVCSDTPWGVIFVATRIDT